MPAVIPVVTYPFDPTGIAVTNLVNNEIQVIQSFNYQNEFLIVPNYSPFYGSSLIVSYSVNGTTYINLQEGIDYILVFPYWAATRSIGLPVYGGILILNNALTGIVTLEYQTIGGVWCANTSYVLTTLSQNLANPRSVLWDVLTNVQQIFPPINHSEMISNVYGLDTLLASLSNMAATIANRPARVLTITPTVTTTTFILDRMSSTTVPAVAYSVRKLSSIYTGFCINVVRSVDNTNKDIGFTSDGNLDIVTLLAFVGNSNGLIAVWYDQSGNNINAIQLTNSNCPYIVYGGELNVQAWLPSINFNNNNVTGAPIVNLATAAQNLTPYGSSPCTINSVASFNIVTQPVQTLVSYGTSAANSGRLVESIAGPITKMGLDISGTSLTYSKSLDSNELFTVSSNFSSLTPSRGHINGYSVGTVNTAMSTPATTSVFIGSAFGTIPNANWSGGISELIIFTNVLPVADRITLEQNQKSFFNM